MSARHLVLLLAPALCVGVAAASCGGTGESSGDAAPDAADTTLETREVGETLDTSGTDGAGDAVLDYSIPDAPFEPVRDIVAIAASTCALMATGAVKCWGIQIDGPYDADAGASDAADASEPLVKLTRPTKVEGLPAVRSLVGSVGRYCAIHDADGAVTCWGISFGVDAPASGTKDLRVPSQGPVTALGTGVRLAFLAYKGVCVAVAGRPLRCHSVPYPGEWTGPGSAEWSDDPAWGTINARAPVPALASDDLVQVGQIGSTAYTSLPNACYVLKSGAVGCDGYNDVGQLGRGFAPKPDASADSGGLDPGARYLYEEIKGLGNVVEVAGGIEHVCARTSLGEMYCWGGNGQGQLGDGTTVHRSSPTKVALSNVVSIAASAGKSCAVLADGTAWCWGVGILGDGGPAGVVSSIPLRVAALSDAKRIFGYAEAGHNCVLRASGQVVCWGANDYGQLGDGTTTDRLVPVPVSW